MLRLCKSISLTLCEPHGCSSCTISRSLLRSMPTESVMLSTHPILCHPLLLLPSLFPSTSVFSNELLFTSDALGMPGAGCSKTPSHLGADGAEDKRTHGQTLPASHLSSALRKDAAAFMSVSTIRKGACDSRIVCYGKLRPNGIEGDLPQNT